MCAQNNKKRLKPIFTLFFFHTLYDYLALITKSLSENTITRMYGISNVSLTVMSTTHIHRCPRHFSEHQCVGTQHDGPPSAPPAHAGFLYQSSASAHRTRVHRCVATLRNRSSCHAHSKKPGAVAYATTPGERRFPSLYPCTNVT